MTINIHTQKILSRTRMICATAALAGAGYAHAEKVIVQLRSPSTFQTLQKNYQNALKMRARVGVFGEKTVDLPRLPDSNARVLSTFGQLNMAVVEVNSAAELAALQNNPEIAFAETEMFYPAPTPMASFEASAGRRRNSARSFDEKPWGIKAVKATEAWTTISGAQGSGAKVVVLDTGVDKSHPDLANRVIGGRNFISKTSTAPSTPNSDSFLLAGFVPTAAEPNYDYFDQNGHGTHVSGTIAAELDNQGVVGVAPQAKILMGRVCGKFGCSSVGIVNGVNWAIEQGADVLSMSLGGPMGSKAQREALEQADAAGVIAVAASGNDGSNKVSYPAAFPTVIAVGAVDAKLKRAEFSQYGPELAIMAPGVDVLSTVPMGSGRVSQVFTYVNGQAKEVTSTSFVGAPLANKTTNALVPCGIGRPEQFPAEVAGKFALIKRGEIPFSEKVNNAIQAGAKGVVVYNNEAGLISGALTQDGSTVSVPVVMVEKGVGEELVSLISSGQAQQLSMATIATDHAAFQGTSMATPHVAGVVALIRAANKRVTPAQVRNLIRQTAQPLESTPDNKYGAGLVDASAAVSASLSL